MNDESERVFQSRLPFNEYNAKAISGNTLIFAEIPEIFTNISANTLS